MSGTCNQCQQKMDAAELILDKYTNMKKKIQSIDFRICEHEELIQLFEETASFFHPLDEDFFKFLDQLSGRLYFAQDYVNCLQVVKLMLINYEFNGLIYKYTTGIMEQKTATICWNLGLIAEAISHLNKAEEILKVTHGEDSSEVSQCKTIRNQICMQNQ